MTSTPCTREPGVPGPPSPRHLKFLDTVTELPQTGVSRPVVRALRADGVPYRTLWDAAVSAVLAECGLRSRFLPSDDGWTVVVDDERTAAADGVQECDLDPEQALAQALAADFSPGSRQFRLLGLPDSGLVVVAVNHLVFDGMSLLLLLERLAVTARGGEPDRGCPHERTDAWLVDDAAGRFEASRRHWADHLDRYGMWTSLRLPTLVRRPGLEPRPAYAVSRTLVGEEAGPLARGLGLGGYAALPALVAAVRAQEEQDDRFGVEVITSGRVDRARARCIDFLGDYLSVGLADLPADADRDVVRRSFEVHRHAVHPRWLLRPTDPERLVPHESNLLFRADQEQSGEYDRYLDGVARDVTDTVPHPAPSGPPTRVMPGVMASVLRTADGSVRLRVDAATDDLSSGSAEALLDDWARRLVHA